jgi:hypothetical protein
MQTVLSAFGMRIETNSTLYRLQVVDGEEVLELTDHTEINDISGEVALLGSPRRDFSMVAEMRFLGHHVPDFPNAGWFGFVARAQDTDNFELVWFMPRAEKGSTVAYLAVAHGVCPWWTEAYATQQKAGPEIPDNEWFRARIDVLGDELAVYVDDDLVFKKKLTYYLGEGRPGFFVGTGTDAAFRRVAIKDLPDESK